MALISLLNLTSETPRCFVCSLHSAYISEQLKVVIVRVTVHVVFRSHFTSLYGDGPAILRGHPSHM